MADEKSTNSAPKKRSRPPKNRTSGAAVETNQRNAEHEFCSYTSTSTSLSSYYFGFNILDYFTEEQLESIIKDPINNNEILRKISLILYGINGTYTNTVDYMAAMPTLDKVIVTHGKSAKKKQANKQKMESTLRTIKDKEFVRDALFKGMIEGIAFYYFETTTRPANNQKMMTDYDVESIIEINELGINASIISLPTDYTRIVTRKNSSYVIAFNLDYFDVATGETTENKLKKYPKEIREAYKKRRNGSSNGGNWVVLDNNKTIVHKIKSKQDEKWGRPLVLAAIRDILYSDYFVDTKRSVLDEINNQIIYQTFPEGKDKGVSALTKTQQQKQHDAVKGAVLNKNDRGGKSFFSVAAGTKINYIDATNTDILEDTYESDLDDKIALGLGIAGSLLNGVGSGTYSAQENNLELVSSQLFAWIEQIESELNKCINANIIKDKNNWVECRYLPITNVNKGKMVGYAKDLYLQGKGSLTLWASACGISSDVFYALLDEELEENVENKYPVHITSYVTSGNDTGGRPETDEPSDNTIKSQSNNGNAIPSPSDNE